MAHGFNSFHIAWHLQFLSANFMFNVSVSGGKGSCSYIVIVMCEHI